MTRRMGDTATSGEYLISLDQHAGMERAAQQPYRTEEYTW